MGVLIINESLFYHFQDCVALIPPNPFYEHDPDDFDVALDFDKLWFARLQLLFRVTVRPCGNLSNSEQDIELSLAFFTTFDDDIRSAVRERDSMLTDYGCKLFFEAKETKPICYVGPISNILGRAPLMPCYLDGNPTPTIPHSFSHLRHPKYKALGIFPDSKPGSGNGSKLYRLNMFLWSFGRSLPRGQEPEQSIEACEERRRKTLSDARKKALETSKGELTQGWIRAKPRKK